MVGQSVGRLVGQSVSLILGFLAMPYKCPKRELIHRRGLLHPSYHDWIKTYFCSLIMKMSLAVGTKNLDSLPSQSSTGKFLIKTVLEEKTVIVELGKSLNHSICNVVKLSGSRNH